MLCDTHDLIETYWNVNKAQKGYYIDKQSDLIETYWNVNTLGIVKKWEYLEI